MKRKRSAYKAKGALVINPTRKRRSSTRRRRTNGASRRKHVKNVSSVTVRYKPKRRTRKNPLRMRRGMGALRVRRNPRGYSQTTISERPGRKKNPRKRRSAPKVMRTRRKNPMKRRTARRKNPGYMKKLEKVPVIGPFLAGSAAMLAPAAVGAVSVETNRMVNSGLARIYPDMPAWASHAVAGIVLGGLTVVLGPKTGLVRKDTAKMLGAAMAAAGGALAYDKLTTEPESTVEDAMGALAVRGLPVGNPILGLGQTVAGLAGMGDLYGRTHTDDAFGNAQAVFPGPVPAASQDAGVIYSSAGYGHIG